MEKIYFKNGYRGGTPIPKVIYWYYIHTKQKGSLNADICNKWLNNELKEFFKKYPEELENYGKVTDEDIKFYKKEIKIKGE